MEKQKKPYTEMENKKKKLLKKFKKVAQKIEEVAKSEVCIESMGMRFDNDMKIMIETTCRRVKIKVRIYENNTKHKLAMYLFKGKTREEGHTSFYRKYQIKDLDKHLKQMLEMLEYGLE